MGTLGVRFHASTRVASTGNLRGSPLSGSDCSEPTSTAPPPSVFRRRGSNATSSPASGGTTVIKPPMTIAAALAKKLRRSEGVGGGRSGVAMHRKNYAAERAASRNDEGAGESMQKEFC